MCASSQHSHETTHNDGRGDRAEPEIQTGLSQLQSLCHALSSHGVQTQTLPNMHRGSSATDRKEADNLERLADPHRMCAVG